MAESVYEAVGGMKTFTALVDAFYRRVETDPVLRPVYPTNSSCFHSARDHLALFLAQFFGGPRTYSEKRGHPHLRMRHARFRIGQAERDAWLTNMLAAMDEVAIPEDAAGPMRRYFEEASEFLINHGK